MNFEKARRAIVEHLNRLAPGAQQTRPHHLQLLLVQIDAILETMARAQGGDLAEACREAMAAGASNTFTVVQDFERRFGDAAVAERLAAVRPVFPVEAFARITNEQNLILEGLSTRLREGIASELGTSIALGEGIAKATRRLRQHVEGEAWQVERIARTEINAAMNAGHEAAINQAATSFPELGLSKQWSAHLDRRTSAICRQLDGDVVPHDAEFNADGWSGRYPPAHPNCRSRVQPYAERWGGKQQRSPEAKARDEQAYQAQRAAATAARAEERKRARQAEKAKKPAKVKATKKSKAGTAPAPVPAPASNRPT